MISERYTYKNAPIPGGGYVTGFLYDENEPGKLYLRTDIGGTYKLNRETMHWESLIDHVTMEDLRETFPIALAKSGKRLYILSGTRHGLSAKLSVTEDEGLTFNHYDLPFMAHGNLCGRGTGSRLIADPENPDTLWYASQTQGLFVSRSGGADWELCHSMPEKYLTFVTRLPGGALVVGSAGVTTARSVKMRGKGLYISENGGETFHTLRQPEDIEIPEVLFSGLVPQRSALDDRYLYVTFQIMGMNAWDKDLGYSCDGGSAWGGKLVRYDLNTLEAEDITPSFNITSAGAGSNPMDSGGTFGEKEFLIQERGLKINPFGLSGIACSRTRPGLVAVSTVSSESGDCIFRSFNYGADWQVILHDLDTGCMDFRTEYMKPQYNGGHNLIHWMSDLKINPFNPDELWFNTGTGPFRTENLTAETVHFSDWPDGIEETVHINCYSPCGGEVQLLDIVGDLGGFPFKDLDHPCKNSFSDPEGNRYITCLNADFSDLHPEKVVVTARGNWTGLTKGGLIYSEDQCETFRHIDQPYGLSERLDRMLSDIEMPNVNPGFAALSPDGNTIVWTLADRVFLPADAVVVSRNAGKSFRRVRIYGIHGEDLSSDSGRGFKVFSDRLRNDVFYGFGEAGQFYVSRDGGYSFSQKRIDLCGAQLALVDCADKTEIRGESGRSGVFYLALKEHGMYKLTYDPYVDTTVFTRLSAEGDTVYRLGLGPGTPAGSYMKEPKAIYIAAVIGGEYGFYRTLDEGQTYTRLNTAAQMYGEINSISGDPRVYGRFYLATGSRGILYGEPVSVDK